MRFETLSETDPETRTGVGRPPDTGPSERASRGRHSPQEALQSTARIVGRKWHPVILHRLLADGPLGFNDLLESLPDLSSKVLSDGLEDLTRWGVVEREIVQERPVRVTYSATTAGRELRPVLSAMDDWGTEHRERLVRADE